MSAAPNGDVLVKCGAGEIFDDIVARTLKAHRRPGRPLPPFRARWAEPSSEYRRLRRRALAERLSSVTVYDRAEKVVRVLTVEVTSATATSIMKTEAGRSFVVLLRNAASSRRLDARAGLQTSRPRLRPGASRPKTVTAPVMSEIVRAVRARKLPDPR